MTWHVAEKRRVLIAGLHFPQAAVEGIKHAAVVVRGVPVTFFRHDYETWRALRNRGLLPPSPLRYYDWPGRFKPMKHQVETVEHFILHDRCFCLDGLGTGKTNAAIWAADYLQSIGEIRRVLVVAPLSITEHVWERELFLSMPHHRPVVLKGSRAAKQKLAEDFSYDWLIVNFESLHLITDHLLNVDLVIVDEFTKIKNAGTRRYKALRKAAAGRRLWMMSGTPAPQAPTDAYAPIRLVNPRKISFMAFRDMTMRKVSQFKWAANPDADKVIAEWMQPSIRHAREDCFDIPDVQTLELHADLTKQQRDVINMLTVKARALLADGQEITAANAAALLTKILQVEAGGVYDADHEVHHVDAAPYFEAIEGVLDQADTPVLIFVNFRSSAQATAEYLEKKGYRIGRVLGGSRERAALFDAFQAGELDAIVAVPSTMSHGLTLTRSRIVVWTSPPFSFETYEQADGRVIRRGQKNKVLIYHLIQSSLDKDLFSRLKSRQRLQEAVLNLLTIKEVTK
jgi:SNF2 family DNA or RNA helicase